MTNFHQSKNSSLRPTTLLTHHPTRRMKPKTRDLGHPPNLQFLKNLDRHPLLLPLQEPRRKLWKPQLPPAQGQMKTPNVQLPPLPRSLLPNLLNQRPNQRYRVLHPWWNLLPQSLSPWGTLSPWTPM